MKNSYFLNFLFVVLILISLGFIFLFIILWYFGKDLPNFEKLENYEPPVVSRIYAADGNFLEEYSRENRIFSSYEQIPKQLINCFLVAEDRNFFTHYGFDIKGILRAFLKNSSNIFNDKRPEGASTITQQVAKNFLLSGEISYSRKIKEIILALRIENLLTKNEILELYLNEIYLGNRSYGVVSASANYFNKSLYELELHEMALLAALPKAPSKYNPFINSKKSIERRNWVLSRLLAEGFINSVKYEKFVEKDLKLQKKNKIFRSKASFFKEAIRREIIENYSEKKLYDQGLSIISSLDTNLQLVAEKVFQNGIKNFDKRKGWRGVLGNIKVGDEWNNNLKKFKKNSGNVSSDLSVVLKINQNSLEVGKLDASKKQIFRENLGIIKKKSTINFDKFFNVGDLILVDNNTNDLIQTPDVNGGLVVIENNSGRILAMVGGYDSTSSFNRVNQAMRQPGSAFKPFVYATALENSFSPVSRVLDAPVIIENPTNKKKWRPQNYGKKFFGLSTLRLGMEKSRNLMTVRLAKLVGLDKIKDLSLNFGIYDEFPKLMSSSLGSVETSLIKIASGYAIFANGGYYVKPSLIDKIQDRYGKTLYKQDRRICKSCKLDSINFTDAELKNLEVLPQIYENRKKVVSSETAFQITSLLMGVIKRGTAKNLNFLDFQVAGKTGTTNNNQDAWFIGYNSEITVGIYIGYDEPKTLGKSETGSKVAAPIFGEFMKTVYSKRKPMPFLVPEGIKFVNVNIKTGIPSNNNFIQESLKKDFDFENEIKNFIVDENFEDKGFY